MPITKIAFAIIGTLCLAALSVYIYLASRGGSKTLYSTIDYRLLSWKQNAFLLLSVVGFLLCMFTGAEFMLRWMPLSWGHYSEDSGYIENRYYLATCFAIFGGFAFIGVIDNATRNTIQLDLSKQRAEFLERIVLAGEDRDLLASIRRDIDSRLKPIYGKMNSARTAREIDPIENERSRIYEYLLRLVDHRSESIVKSDSKRS